MSLCQHIPAPPLNQYVAWLWFYCDYYPDHDRQFVLPDGTFELIINLEDRPRKLFNRDDFSRHRSFRRAWISGTQKQYLVIDALQGSSMIGAHFKPGGAAPLLGLPADELSDQVVELDALWGIDAVEWRERLLAAPSPQAKLSLTTGTMEFKDGQIVTHEEVKGDASGITEVRSTNEILPGGKFHVKAEYLKDGKWSLGHEVTYQEDPASEVIFK